MPEYAVKHKKRLEFRESLPIFREFSAENRFDLPFKQV